MRFQRWRFVSGSKAEGAKPDRMWADDSTKVV
jgi:hypothetical protein